MEFLISWEDGFTLSCPVRDVDCVLPDVGAAVGHDVETVHLLGFGDGIEGAGALVVDGFAMSVISYSIKITANHANCRNVSQGISLQLNQNNILL